MFLDSCPKSFILTAAPSDQNPGGISGIIPEPKFAYLEMFGIYNLAKFDENGYAVYKHLKYPDRYSMKKGSLRDGIEGWWVSR